MALEVLGREPLTGPGQGLPRLGDQRLGRIDVGAFGLVGVGLAAVVHRLVGGEALPGAPVGTIAVSHQRARGLAATEHSP